MTKPTPETLHAACEAADPERVRALLAAGADVTAQDDRELTPFDVLPFNQKGSEACVRALLDAGAAPPPDWLDRAKSGYAFKVMAALADHGFMPEDVENVCAEIEAYPAVRTWVAKGARLSLCTAACVSPPGAVDLIEGALAAGKKLDETEKSSGWTALHYAVQRSNLAAVELLLARGAAQKATKNDEFNEGRGSDQRFRKATPAQLATLVIKEVPDELVADARAIAAMLGTKSSTKKATSEAKLVAGEETYASLIAGHAFSRKLGKPKLDALMASLAEHKIDPRLVVCRIGDTTVARSAEVIVGVEIAGVDADSSCPSGPISGSAVTKGLAAARKVPATLWAAISKICGAPTTDQPSLLLAASGPLATAVLARGVTTFDIEGDDVVYGQTMAQERHGQGVTGARLTSTDSVRELDATVLAAVKGKQVFLIAQYD